MGKLDGKVAVITGAAVGLGAGIAEAFVKHGAKICMINRSARVEETAERLRKQYNAQIVTALADVSNREQMEAAVKKTVDTFGAVHIACCNAGVCQLAPFEQMTDEMFDFHINVNIKGAWNTCKAVIPYMLKQGGGSIVIASSVTGDIVADAGEAAYATTIRVNCTQLGYARTPMVEGMAAESNPADPEKAIRDIALGVPMGRLAQPVEVGELTAFLASDEASYITGAQIVIDGGSTLPETMSMGTN